MYFGEPRRRLGRASILRPLGLVALLLFFPSVITATAESSREATLVVLSLDGVRYDYPDRVRGGGFERLEREGVRAERLIPPFPASTFPAHATLATGCYPERHGILNSHFLDSSRGEFERSEDPSWLGCEPIWITAQRQGASSAVLNWVASYGKWRGLEADFHDKKFHSLRDWEAIRLILGWLRLPATTRPRLVTAYLSAADHAGHEGGPRSEAVNRRIRSLDALLGLFLREVQALPFSESIQVIVVADHGMTSRKGWLDPERVLRENRIPHRMLASGGAANLYLSRPEDRMRALLALRALPGLEVFPGDRLPEELHYAFPGRAGDLVLVAPLGLELTRPTDATAAEGVHGYRGGEKEMGGIFFGWGSRFRRGRRLAALRAIDVYSVACAVLGIRPSQGTQGQVPAGLLNPDPARDPLPRR